jgi:hypothetical protein
MHAAGSVDKSWEHLLPVMLCETLRIRMAVTNTTGSGSNTDNTSSSKTLVGCSDCRT